MKKTPQNLRMSEGVICSSDKSVFEPRLMYLKGQDVLSGCRVHDASWTNSASLSQHLWGSLAGASGVCGSRAGNSVLHNLSPTGQEGRCDYPHLRDAHTESE